MKPHKVSAAPVVQIDSLPKTSPAASPDKAGSSDGRTEAIKIDAPTKQLDPRPKIQLAGDGRTISELAMELGQVLSTCGIYFYAGQAAVYDEKTKTLDPIKPAKFRTWAEKSVITFKDGKEGPVDVTMGSGEAGAVLLSDQFLGQLREVDRINGVQLPVIRADGKVELLTEGYDRESKILTATDSIKYQTDMTLDEAKKFIEDMVKEFPFADVSRSKGICVGAMLTLFCLDLMPPKTILPSFLYRGNHPGLGKGLLVQEAMIPVLGFTPTGVKPKDETEMRKMLFAIAKGGQPVVFLDNVTGRVASPSLESFATTSTVSGRVLGTSTSLNCKKNSVIFITGNNCTLSGDMARRTLIAELFLAGDPGERTIEHHLDENRLLELRPQILAALFALVRSWADAGKPKPAKINPNFVVWSEVIGGIVEHAGFGSITEVAANAAASIDTQVADMASLVKALFAKHRTEGVKFSEMVAIAREHKLFTGILVPGNELGRAEKTALGRLFSSFDQRMFGSGLRFVILGKGHARRYAVQKLAVPEEGADV
ncbi:MAG: hypothetical protein WCD79_14750 [Chthoniobacteraceae bacterium]